ncbi:MAG: saccharopine dehydrogenase NADP-binding domain-containing protein [Deltaproteobacteria bacterium]|nr:saccharopine dehydrogenase NADP-binding domain-containing protein [Deltaproteobacteria bacterium]
MVRHILEASSHTVTVAARSVDRANELVRSHPRGNSVAFDIDDDATLDRLAANSDVMVSMLPYLHHVKVAERCIAHGHHLVTTSYVSLHARPARQRQGRGRGAAQRARARPGIDHMSAMKIIHGIRAAGSTVTSFRSYCGGSRAGVPTTPSGTSSPGRPAASCSRRATRRSTSATASR